MPQLTPKQIGNLCAYARRKQKKTVYRVSKDTGLTENQITGIEKGGNPTTNTLFPLLKGLGITIELKYNQRTLKGFK